MSDDEMIQSFLKRVEKESNYRKFLKREVIDQIVRIFTANMYEKLVYSKDIDNCLEMALQFYKDYNLLYYQMIVDGLHDGRIVISDDIIKSYVDTENGVSYICLVKDDSDVFVLVHEFAHFIDRNSSVPIVPDDFWFLSETFSFYMEKQLERWLPKEKYEDLISIRRNNRMYFETNMLNVVCDQLYYEDLYAQNGFISEDEISIKKVKNIMKYPDSNLVNYLLMYPVANILSSYLLDSGPMEEAHQMCDRCFEVDWFLLLPRAKVKAKNNRNYFSLD